MSVLAACPSLHTVDVCSTEMWSVSVLVVCLSLHPLGQLLSSGTERCLRVSFREARVPWEHLGVHVLVLECVACSLSCACIFANARACSCVLMRARACSCVLVRERACTCVLGVRVLLRMHVCRAPEMRTQGLMISSTVRHSGRWAREQTAATSLHKSRMCWLFRCVICSTQGAGKFFLQKTWGRFEQLSGSLGVIW